MRLPDGFQLIDDGRSSAEGTTPPALPPGFQLIDAAPAPQAGPKPRESYGFMDAAWGSLPFADEVAGAAGEVASWVTGKGGYQETKRQEEVDRAHYAEQNPGKSALATGAAGLSAIGNAAGVAIPVGLAQTMKQGAKQGAAIGGLYGAGEGEGLTERVGNAGRSALVGAGLGAAVPAGVAGAGALAGGIKRLASPITNAAANRITPDNRAASLAAEAFRRDGVPIDQAGTRLDAMRRTSPETVLADVGGENVRGISRAVVNTPGSGREKVAAFMEARRLDQPDRIVNSVRAVLKNPDDFAKTTARMAAEREKIAGPIYQSAFSKPVAVNVSRVIHVIDNKIAPGVAKLTGPSDLRPDGIAATIGNIRSFFATKASQRTDLRELHGVKTEIDDMIGAAKRSGETGKVRALMDVKRELLRAMDSASPDYKKARAIYSSTHELDEALEIGRGALSSRMTADDMKSELARMDTPAQREMVQVGLARGIKDAAEAGRDGHDLVKTLFGSPRARSTLRAAFQDDKAFRRFEVTMMREAAIRKTDDAIRGNSSTAKQFADLMETHSGGVGRDVLDLLVDGKPGQAVAAAVRQAIAGEKGISAKVADKLSNLLLSNDPAQIQRAMTSLARKEQALARVKAALASVGGASGRLVAGQAAASQ